MQRISNLPLIEKKLLDMLNAAWNEAVLLIPALAGFQSEHAVEIPFMLTTTTTTANLAARGSKRLFIEGVWGCSSNWKCSGEGFS